MIGSFRVVAHGVSDLTLELFRMGKQVGIGIALVKEFSEFGNTQLSLRYIVKFRCGLRTQQDALTTIKRLAAAGAI